MRVPFGAKQSASAQSTEAELHRSRAIRPFGGAFSGRVVRRSGVPRKDTHQVHRSLIVTEGVPSASVSADGTIVNQRRSALRQAIAVVPHSERDDAPSGGRRRCAQSPIDRNDSVVLGTERLNAVDTGSSSSSSSGCRGSTPADAKGRVPRKPSFVRELRLAAASEVSGRAPEVNDGVDLCSTLAG